MSELVCYSCGSSLQALSMPLRRLDVCPSCDRELHVCRMCQFYDTTVAKSCREPIAEEVREKDKANFCDYLKLATDAYTPPDREKDRSMEQLRAMFGDDPNAAPDSGLDQLEALFKKKDD